MHLSSFLKVIPEDSYIIIRYGKTDEIRSHWGSRLEGKLANPNFPIGAFIKDGMIEYIRSTGEDSFVVYVNCDNCA